jgi:hypothetical protein
LETTIERQARFSNLPWSALEHLVIDEFKSRAPMHLTPPSIPADKFTWLALMQHYGAPTRLLDFSNSPFVALYFAIRGAGRCLATRYVRLWAIDARKVNAWFKKSATEARAEERKHDAKPVSHRPRGFFLNPATDSDVMRTEIEELRKLIDESLAAQGSRRSYLNKSGCVCVASPPAFNPRLAAQQGKFLLNCAEALPLNESLTKMMSAAPAEWCKVLDIAASAIPEIERQLFQRNIHEQSLFPDLAGLAGLIGQEIRLHWR